MEVEEEEVEVEPDDEDEEPEIETEEISRREQFVSNLDEDDAEDFDAEDEYVVVYGEDPDGEFGEPVQSEPTRDSVREACSDLMGGEYHPENLFPDRYEEVEELEIPDDLEETLDDESETEYEYSEIQEIAKSHDVKANQGTEDLIEDLIEIRDQQEAAEA